VSSCCWCHRILCVQVKKLGESSDIVYLSYQGKLGVCARDLCLLRAWQTRPDGSTVLVSNSVECDDVPRVAGKVRAECHDCAYMVSVPSFTTTSSKVVATCTASLHGKR